MNRHATIPIGAQQATERMLAAAGKAVESRYYEGEHHIVIEDQFFQDDAAAATIAFSGRYML